MKLSLSEKIRVVRGLASLTLNELNSYACAKERIVAISILLLFYAKLKPTEKFHRCWDFYCCDKQRQIRFFYRQLHSVVPTDYPLPSLSMLSPSLPIWDYKVISFQLGRVHVTNMRTRNVSFSNIQRLVRTSYRLSYFVRICIKRYIHAIDKGPVRMHWHRRFGVPVSSLCTLEPLDFNR